MQPRLTVRVCKGELGKVTFACTAVHQCQSKAQFHFGIPCFQSAHVPTASQKGSAAFTVKGQGMISGSQRARVCPRVWLDNVIEQAPALAGQSDTLLSIPTPPSSLFFLIGRLTNQQIDHVCCANKWRAEVIQRAEQKPATASWWGRRREHDSLLYAEASYHSGSDHTI